MEVLCAIFHAQNWIPNHETMHVEFGYTATDLYHHHKIPYLQNYFLKITESCQLCNFTYQQFLHFQSAEQYCLIATGMRR